MGGWWGSVGIDFLLETASSGHLLKCSFSTSENQMLHLGLISINTLGLIHTFKCEKSNLCVNLE